MDNPETHAELDTRHRTKTNKPQKDEQRTVKMLPTTDGHQFTPSALLA
jgi:hypothetical protein